MQVYHFEAIKVHEKILFQKVFEELWKDPSGFGDKVFNLMSKKPSIKNQVSNMAALALVLDTNVSQTDYHKMKGLTDSNTVSVLPNYNKMITAKEEIMPAAIVKEKAKRLRKTNENNKTMYSWKFQERETEECKENLVKQFLKHLFKVEL